MSDLATTIELLQSRRGGDMSPETAEFVIAYTRLLAQGKPVSAQALADELSEPVEFIITQKPISITIAPHGVEHIQPQETVLSIMTAPGCSAGIDGTFCSQVIFFASHEAATGWIGKRSDFSILSASASYQLARTIYIEPVMRHIRS